MSHQQLGLDKQDAFRLYLAYHEGHGGYKRQTYQSKSWLVDVARKVERQAQRYNTQLQELLERARAARVGLTGGDHKSRPGRARECHRSCHIPPM